MAGETRLGPADPTLIDVRATALPVDTAAALPEGHRIVAHHAPAGLLRVMQVLRPDGADATIFEGEQ